jgi:hypothetical protein
MNDDNPPSWARINLKLEVATIPPGTYNCVVADARTVEPSTGDAIWLFIILAAISSDGEVLGQVEDRFITLAAAPGSPNETRLAEGLRRLALYGAATGLSFDELTPYEIPEMLLGKRVRASISRKGVGIMAENKVGTIGKVD